MLKKYYLGGFFLVPIPVKQYQNTSGFGGEDVRFSEILPTFSVQALLNIRKVSLKIYILYKGLLDGVLSEKVVQTSLDVRLGSRTFY